MCLGIPMRITSIDGYYADCQAKGVGRKVNLFLLQHEQLVVDDYVMVHVGYALQKISQEDARLTWEIFDRMLDSETITDQESFDPTGSKVAL
ncbi:Uncharacterized hydrogenase expression/formation protein MJ0200 [Gammaproteobacteria bacterium]